MIDHSYVVSFAMCLALSGFGELGISTVASDTIHLFRA